MTTMATFVKKGPTHAWFTVSSLTRRNGDAFRQTKKKNKLAKIVEHAMKTKLIKISSKHLAHISRGLLRWNHMRTRLSYVCHIIAN